MNTFVYIEKAVTVLSIVYVSNIYADYAEAFQNNAPVCKLWKLIIVTLKMLNKIVADDILFIVQTPVLNFC